MIIIVNGILGVGKSSTAQRLAQRLENSVYLQGDDYSEFEEFNPRSIEHLLRVIGDIANEANRLSIERNIVVDYIFEDQVQLRHFLSLINANNNYTHFYLQCNESEHRKRILSRNREDVAWELERIVELQRTMEESWWKGNCTIIDTSFKSIDTVVDEMLTKLS